MRLPSSSLQLALWLPLVFCLAAPAGPLASYGARVPVSYASNPDALDINVATPAELKALPGMGDAYVKRIIEGRPYTAKNQLVTRGILPQAAYDRIRDQIVAHRPRA